MSGFANIAKPLTRLTKEKQAFQWTPKVKAAFQSLKEALRTAPFLAYPQPKKKFIVDTYASNVGIGGVLSQVQDGQERVTTYYSKKLNKAKINYCITQWELLAIVRTLEHFLKYLYRQEFHLRTNHSALAWLMSPLRDKQPAGFSAYKNTTSLASTIKARNTTMPMPLPNNNAEKSIPTAKKSRRRQTSSRYELLQL
jgi:hypothetical protein